MMDPTRDDQDQHGSPTIRGDDIGRKRVIGEVDFFADRGKISDHHHHRHHMIKPTHDHLHDKVDQDQIEPRDHHLDVNTGLCLLTTNTSSDKSTVDDGSSDNNMEDNKKPVVHELAVLQAEMDRMNSENQRLRGLLGQVNNSYNALTLQLAAFMQRQHNQKPETTGQERNNMAINGLLEENQRRFAGAGARQFMDTIGLDHLDISRNSSEGIRSQNCSKASPQNEIIESMDCKSLNAHALRESSGRNNNIVNNKELLDPNDEDIQGGQDQQLIAGGSRWVPNKVPRVSSNSRDDQEQTVSDTMSMIRKARVSVRARSEAAMISDGCQWRKYGQKMAKGNPCPRAYYRCTMATGCPVRKQVQRCAEDQTILTTTYEGNHNHPLPPAAMAMAQTTSSAASMLLSGSMPSPDHLGLNPNNFLGRAGLSCHGGGTTSFATLSASAPFPTVTLDLTTTNNPSPSADQIISQLRNLSQGDAMMINNSNNAASHVLLGHGIGNSKIMAHPSEFLSSAEHVSAAVANPNFTAVLMAALTSFMGNNNDNNGNNNNNTCSIATRSSSEKN